MIGVSWEAARAVMKLALDAGWERGEHEGAVLDPDKVVWGVFGMGLIACGQQLSFCKEPRYRAQLEAWIEEARAVHPERVDAAPSWRLPWVVKVHRRAQGEGWTCLTWQGRLCLAPPGLPVMTFQLGGLPGGARQCLTVEGRGATLEEARALHEALGVLLGWIDEAQVKEVSDD